MLCDFPISAPSLSLEQSQNFAVLQEHAGNVKALQDAKAEYEHTHKTSSALAADVHQLRLEISAKHVPISASNVSVVH